MKDITKLDNSEKYKKIANSTKFCDKYVHHMTREELNIFLGWLIENSQEKDITLNKILKETYKNAKINY